MALKEDWKVKKREICRISVQSQQDHCTGLFLTGEYYKLLHAVAGNTKNYLPAGDVEMLLPKSFSPRVTTLKPPPRENNSCYHPPRFVLSLSSMLDCRGVFKVLLPAVKPFKYN